MPTTSLAQLAADPSSSTGRRRGHSLASLASIQAGADALSNLGQNGDSELVHVNPEEIAQLEEMSGNTSTNSVTGLRQFYDTDGGDDDGDDSGDSDGDTDSDSANDTGGDFGGDDDRSGGPDSGSESGASDGDNDAPGSASTSDAGADSEADAGTSATQSSETSSTSASSQASASVDAGLVGSDYDGLAGGTSFTGGHYDAGYGGGPGAAGGQAGGGLADWGGGTLHGHNFSEDSEVKGQSLKGHSLSEMSSMPVEAAYDALNLGNSLIEDFGNAVAEYGLSLTERMPTMKELADQLDAGYTKGQAVWEGNALGQLGTVAGLVSGIPGLGTLGSLLGDELDAKYSLGPEVFSSNNSVASAKSQDTGSSLASLASDTGLTGQANTVTDSSATGDGTASTLAQLVAAAGRDGDTALIHASPEAQAVLASLGGRGTVNPETGLFEFAKKYSAFDTDLWAGLYGDTYGYDDDTTSLEMWSDYLSTGRNSGYVANMGELMARDAGFSDVYNGNWGDAISYLDSIGYDNDYWDSVQGADASSLYSASALESYIASLSDPTSSLAWDLYSASAEAEDPLSEDTTADTSETTTSSGTAQVATPSYRSRRLAGTAALGF